ncbi:acyl CoA binding protein-domain-containing protein [Coprinopsis sp. MPI-PUGE-AT-0042]|nr:acyl CoA binding protein-domain-containing protein [Coprinopsis sp. MPI-PUGE-AT-0042]
MATHELIDSQFDRAVQIVQRLPKTGPIQTDYEEKLRMYSLYKQATQGNVLPPRPGVLNMLERAKWDAWAKHKDLNTYEAKWLYVESLIKVLKRYSDRTIARDYVQELESYGGDPSNLVMSRSFSRASGSESSGTADSEPEEEHEQQQLHLSRHLEQPDLSQDEAGSGSEEGEEEKETYDEQPRELPPPRTPLHYENRPRSSNSTQRYRTPAGSLLMSPPPDQRLPSTHYETTSAFAPPLPYPQQPLHPGSYPETVRESPQYQYRPSQYNQPSRPASRPILERAVENVQAHLAALTERIETLETRLASRSQTAISPKGGTNSPRWFASQTSPNGGDGPRWDLEDLGLWSTVLVPLSRWLQRARDWSVFFARDENRSPAKLIVRRLLLDVSFFVFVVAIVGSLWRKSGVRRREIRTALVVLGRALVGSQPAGREVTRAVNKTV